MNREDIIKLAREAGIRDCTCSGAFGCLERFAALVAAAEREAFPDLTPAINWLENGCDSKEAAKELRLYAAAIREKGQA